MRFSERSKRMVASEIRELLKITGAPGMISFAGGYPDPKLLPREKFVEIAKDVILKSFEKSLQYGPTEGILPLRETILKMEKESGVKEIEVENIIVTTGSQQGLDLISKVFLNPREKVIVEAPSYLGAIQAFNLFEAKFISVPLDEKGIKTEILREKLKENKDAKFIYLVPTFHNPAGVTLTLERRKEILDLAEKYDIPVIEDDPYSKIRYEGQNLPSLLSLDRTKNVIKLGTFSKMISGGLRLGWVVAKREIIEKLVLAKQPSDLCSPPFTQYLANEFIIRGYMEEYLKVVRKEYKKKRDKMLSALEKYCQKVSWVKPEGGLFFWLKTNADTDELAKEALKRKVAFVPGSAFYPHREDKCHIRLNFSLPKLEEIEEGIKRIGKLLEAVA